MGVLYLVQEDSRYPSAIKKYLKKNAPERIAVIGNIDILKQDKIAFFCSVRCPGNLIIQALDMAQVLRKKKVTVIGGFHTPVEREVLKILLRSPNPVIICPARSIVVKRVKSFHDYKAEKQGSVVRDQKIDNIRYKGRDPSAEPVLSLSKGSG